MKGRYFWDKDTEQPMLKSVGYFEQANSIDPNFGRRMLGSQMPLPTLSFRDTYREQSACLE